MSLAVLLAGGLVVYLASAILAYGLTLGYFQARWPEFVYESGWQNVVVALSMAVGGPIGLFVIVTIIARRGVSLSCFSLTQIGDEQSWAAHQRRFPNLTRQHWVGRRLRNAR